MFVRYISQVILISVYVFDTCRGRDLLLNYWDSEDENEYREKGRICGACSFPFSYDNQEYYGCMMRGFDLSCMARNGSFVRCPRQCPSGVALHPSFTAGGGPQKHSVILECEGTGSPNPKIIFKKDDLIVKEIEPPSDPYPANVRGELTLTDVPEAHGVYSCELRNSHSYVRSTSSYGQSSYNYTGQGFPDPPSGIKIVTLERNAISIQWDSLDGTTRGIYGTILEIASSSQNKKVIRIYEKTNELTRLILPNVTYSIRIQYITGEGNTRFSEPQNITLPENTPLVGPENFQAIRIRPTSVALDWEWVGLRLEENPEYSLSFEVDSETRREVTTYKTYMVFNNLIPDTNYIFVVKAVGEEFGSDKVSVKTPPLVPVTNPGNVTVEGVTDTTVRLNWDWDGVEKHYDDVMFKVSYRTVSDEEPEKHRDNLYRSYVAITNLLPNTNYSFVISGTTSGQLPMRNASTVYAKTSPSAPSIQYLEVDDEDHSFADIVCRATSRPPPEITWKNNGRPIPTDQYNIVENTTWTLTSKLRLQRNAQTYDKYECVATNEVGVDTDTVKVKYTGLHPQVALEAMVMRLTEKIETIAADVEELKKNCRS